MPSGEKNNDKEKKRKIGREYLKKMNEKVKENQEKEREIQTDRGGSRREKRLRKVRGCKVERKWTGKKERLRMICINLVRKV